MIRVTLNAGETLMEAICRAGMLANKQGENGYIIVCEKCGQPIDEHEHPDDCDTWIRHLGVPPK